MVGWFEFSKSSDNQFWFVLKVGNGEIIFISEFYILKVFVEKGIVLVCSNSL